MGIKDIEAAIKTLPKEDLAQFDQWYQSFHEEQWDEQIRRDVRAGKLDFLLEEAHGERKAGTLRRPILKGLESLSPGLRGTSYPG